MFHANEVHAPISPNNVLNLLDGTSLPNATEYGSLLVDYNNSLTRLNVIFVVNKSIHASIHYLILAWSWTCPPLRGTITHDLFLCRHSPMFLHGFSEAYWAGNTCDRTSTSAHVVFPGSYSYLLEFKETTLHYPLFHWNCMVLILVPWIGIQLPITPTVFCDNTGATYLCANLVFHSRMKHILIDFHFLCDMV